MSRAVCYGNGNYQGPASLAADDVPVGHARVFLGFFFFFQAEDGIRDLTVTGVQTCALPILWGQAVSGAYFDVVQIKPIMGRAFLPEEDNAVGAHPVVVISHSLWQRRFGSDPEIVGQTVRFSNRGYQVIGVAPESFTGSKFALSMDFWVPMAMVEELRRSQGLLASRDSHWMNVLARLKPGATIEQASAELQAISARLNEAYPNERASNTSAKVLSEMDGRWGE